MAGHVKPSASGAAYFLSLGGGIYSGPSPSLGWWPAVLGFLGHYSDHFNFCLHLHMVALCWVPPLCLCVWTSLLFLIKTPVLGFRDPPWSVVTLFPNRSHSDIVGGCEFGRGHYWKECASHLSKPAYSSHYPPVQPNHSMTATQLTSAHGKEACKKIKIIFVLYIYVSELLYNDMS